MNAAALCFGMTRYEERKGIWDGAAEGAIELTAVFNWIVWVCVVSQWRAGCLIAGLFLLMSWS